MYVCMYVFTCVYVLISIRMCYRCVKEHWRTLLMYL